MLLCAYVLLSTDAAALCNTWRHCCAENFVPVVVFCQCLSSCIGRFTSLQWRHNERDGVSNHQPHYSTTDEFLVQRDSDAENVSIWWRHHAEGEIMFNHDPQRDKRRNFDQNADIYRQENTFEKCHLRIVSHLFQSLMCSGIVTSFRESNFRHPMSW